MHIAHVGAERPLTFDDRFRRLRAMTVIGQPTAAWVEDVVNLLYGRDFLVEHTMYDVVILHSIFHTNHATSLAATVADAVLAGPANAIIPISPHHTVDLESWRARLVETGAKHIIVFESQPMSLSGWNLGELEGYCIREQDASITVYESTGR